MTTDPLTLLAAVVLGTIAVARSVRLVVHDAYPPMEWIRDRWLAWAGQHAPGWASWLTCPFCFAPYAAAVNLGWALWSGLSWDSNWGAAWWVVNTWAAVSYLAAMLVLRDEPVE